MTKHAAFLFVCPSGCSELRLNGNTLGYKDHLSSSYFKRGRNRKSHEKLVLFCFEENAFGNNGYIN